MVKLIIFDLDGTLIDSAQDITNAINYSIKDTGLPFLNNEQTIQLVGEGISRLIEKLLPPAFLEHRDEILSRFLEYYSSHLVDNTKPYPFVKDTLDNLKTFTKAVISNKRECLSKEILQRLDLLEYFDTVLGGDSTEERKPSPVPIVYLLNKLSISPEMTVMAGDSNIDIKAAINAGIRSIGVTYGYKPEESLKDADFLIDDIRKLEYVVHKLL
ncbi:phosphoglycolate phosphatase [bacterium BMS3Abin07]|nr:phosphoglycolate phosphatase [bacterium BMS3Abin07]GBE31241.1 phosphoglycolate phosphatase [bacterium BMS3Bbin05]